MSIRFGLINRNDGSSADKAALSAVSILYNYPNSTNGVYWINLPGCWTYTNILFNDWLI
jgi:hypothetical protein